MAFFKILYKKDFSQNYIYEVNSSKDFSWKIGNLSSYWFQVTGCCKKTFGQDACPPLRTDDQNCNKSSSQFIQTILAYSPKEVCQELIASNWNWNICGMQRWSRPAESEYINSLNDECNYLQNVDFINIPECVSLVVNDSVNINFSLNTSVNYIKCGASGCYSYTSISGKTLFYLEGSAYYLLNLGFINEIRSMSDSFSSDTSSVLSLSGDSEHDLLINYDSNGLLILQSDSQFGIKEFKYIASNFNRINLFGDSIFVKDNWFYYPSLFNLVFESISLVKINLSYNSNLSLTLNSLSNFVYTSKYVFSSSGNLVFSSSTLSKKKFSFSSIGNLTLSPSSYYGLSNNYNTNIYWLDFVELKSFIPSDENEFLSDLSYTPDSVSVGCYNCGQIPHTLYYYNNLVNLKYLNEFLLRNNLQLDQYYTLEYSSIKDNWNYYFFNRDSSEEWRIFSAISCYKDDDVDYLWKYYFYASRLKSGQKFETKLIVSVPSEFVCSYNSFFNFSFKFNVLNKRVFINLNSNYDDFMFYDNIGLFDSDYWKQNPDIKIRISDSYSNFNVMRKTISV